MPRRLYRLLMLCCATALLSGCITSQATTSVKKDGTGTNVLVIGFSQQLRQLMGGQGQDPFAEMSESLEDLAADLPEEWQATVAPWSDDDYEGVQIATEFSDLEMLREQIGELLTGEGSLGGSGQLFPLFTEFELEEDGPVVTMRAVANPGALVAQAIAASGGELEEQGLDEDSLELVLGQMKFTWTVELPNICRFEDAGIGQRQGNSVTWTFPVNKDEEVEIAVQGILATSTQRMTTTITSSGGGTNEVVIAADDEVALTDRLVEDAQRRSETFPADWNTRVESWEDGGLRGIKISSAFSDLETLKPQLDQLAGPGANAQCLGRQLLQHVDVRDEDGTIVIGAQVDPAGLSPDTSASWTVALPEVESFVDADVGTRDGNSVTWRFDKPAEAPLTLEVRGSRGANLLMLGIFALLALGVLTVIVGLTLVWRRSRRRPLVPVGAEPGAAASLEPWERPAAGAAGPQWPDVQPFDGGERQSNATAPLMPSHSPERDLADQQPQRYSRQERPAHEPSAPLPAQPPADLLDQLLNRVEEPFTPRVYDVPHTPEPPSAEPSGGASTRRLPESLSSSWDLPLSGSWSTPLGAAPESSEALPPIDSAAAPDADGAPPERGPDHASGEEQK